MPTRSQRHLRETRGYDSSGSTTAPPVSGFVPVAASLTAIGAVGRVVATFTPVGGVAPYSFAITAPAGVSAGMVGNEMRTTIDPAGAVGGRAMTVVVTDGLGRSFSGPFDVTLT